MSDRPHATAVPRSVLDGVCWPAVPPPGGAAMLALQFQLGRSERWPAHLLREWQLRQLALLLGHARETVPYYRRALATVGPAGAPLTYEAFTRVPLLTREALQAAGADLLSRAVPPAHGRLREAATAGSTGHPVRVTKTEFVHWLWLGFILREHLWHDRDLTGKLAAIRSRVRPATLPGWGPATDEAFATGPAVLLDIATDPARQLDWLQGEAPDYLLTTPTNLAALLEEAERRGTRPPGLKESRTYGEVVTSELRGRCRDLWGVPLTDAYSTEEVGYVALQCPLHPHYHVQGEGVLVEVLDHQGAPCAPGTVGRVVVTTLHNFAMPLIRYVLGDYAEVGGPCDCGRGLPVLTRIMGRRRNMLVLPDGRRHWPSLPAEILALPIRRRRVVQRSLDRIEFLMEVHRPLSGEEEARLVAALQRSLGHPFSVTLTCVDRLPAVAGADPASYKGEDFVCEVAGAGR